MSTNADYNSTAHGPPDTSPPVSCENPAEEQSRDSSATASNDVSEVSSEDRTSTPQRDTTPDVPSGDVHSNACVELPELTAASGDDPNSQSPETSAASGDDPNSQSPELISGCKEESATAPPPSDVQLKDSQSENGTEFSNEAGDVGALNSNDAKAPPQNGEGREDFHTVQAVLREVAGLTVTDSPFLGSPTSRSPPDDAPESTLNAQSPPSQADDDEQLHMLKEIDFGGVKARIVTQNENGPCPVIAVVNALILRGKVDFSDSWSISRDRMVNAIADLLISSRPNNLPEQSIADYDRNVNDVIELLPKALDGMFMNVKFGDVRSFEYTADLSLFDLLNIDLYHGWIPEDPEHVRVLRGKSFNEATAIATEESEDARIIRDFVSLTSSQLTNEGLIGLLTTMKDNEISVLFRNNHFHNILRSDDRLFLLVTDHGFLRHKSIVWESLSNVYNDSCFVDGYLREVRPEREEETAKRPPNAADTDYQLALNLQREEEEAAARREPRLSPSANHPNPPSAPTRIQQHRGSHSSGRPQKKESNCVIC